MKRILYLAIAAILFSSCHTALHVTSVQRNSPTKASPNMEFIGLKNMNKNNLMFKELGSDLERANMAINKQNFYMGMFSLQELETYKSSKRYITFVDVARHTYSHSDAVHDNPDMELAGWMIGGLTAFTLIPVYVPLLCAADKNDCQITLKGEYVLYVYDTKKKEVVFTSPFEINENDIYTGQYSHKKTDQKAVNERYKNILYNTFLTQYEQAYNYVNTLPK